MIPTKPSCAFSGSELFAGAVFSFFVMSVFALLLTKPLLPAPLLSALSLSAVTTSKSIASVFTTAASTTSAFMISASTVSISALAPPELNMASNTPSVFPSANLVSSAALSSSEEASPGRIIISFSSLFIWKPFSINSPVSFPSFRPSLILAATCMGEPSARMADSSFSIPASSR